MNAAQVRSKARLAMKRREEEIEEEELEGGELNLVPYLDIVTNIMLFLLATVTTGLIFGDVNVILPEFQDPNAAAATTNPGQENDKFLLTISKKDATLFDIDPSGTATQLASSPAKQPGTGYDFGPINDALYKVVVDRWQGLPLAKKGDDGTDKCVVRVRDPQTGKEEEVEKSIDQCRPSDTANIDLNIDGDIKYDVVVGAMDAVRVKVTDKGPTTLFPGIVFQYGFINGGGQ